MIIKGKFEWNMPYDIDQKESEIIVEYEVYPEEKETRDCPGTPATAEVVVKNSAGEVVSDIADDFKEFLEGEAICRAYEDSLDNR